HHHGLRAPLSEGRNGVARQGDRVVRRAAVRGHHAGRVHCGAKAHQCRGTRCSVRTSEPLDRESVHRAMNLVVVTEHRLARLPERTLWGESGYEFWRRYREVFDGVRLVCRVKDVETAPAGLMRVDGPGVTVAPVPHYVGPNEYLRVAASVRAAVRNAFDPGDAVIMRIASYLATAMA